MTPTVDHRRTTLREPERVLTGADALVHRAMGAWRRRRTVLRQLQARAEAVEGFAAEFAHLTDPRLHERLIEFRERFRRAGRDGERWLCPALAAVREAAHRQTGMRPFPVQLTGALALYDGCLAEMATGEGKTLTASLTAVLWGWTRHPCHIITVNDYLVARDAKWFAPLYHFCGVRVGQVTAQMPPEERRRNYACDITYTTSKEVVADFLRDALHTGSLRDPTRRLIRRMLRPSAGVEEGVVMRGLHGAIVDEADSILIDEAVTPLIISTMRGNETLRDAVLTAQEIVEPFQPGVDYEINHRYREIELTETGRNRLEARCQRLPGLWQGPLRRFELVRQALVAREFYRNGSQYILHDDRVVIVDEFTGRQMPQRTWRAGLHQAIEAKERLPVTDPTDTLARLSFQRFFRLYRRLAGMTGTAREAASELWHIYRLPVLAIPPNKPCLRVQHPDRLFATAEAKWTAITDHVAELHATGRPLLIGTRSVAASEMLAGRLAERGLTCSVLNAVRHAEEATVVAMAGEPGRITIATNMAGRGTDIKLGRGVAALGGLHVIATERHESGRVDRQLFGRAARQGDPGSAQAFVSAEDELLQRYLHRQGRRWVETVLRRDTAAGRRLGGIAFRLAQRSAQRAAFKMRGKVLRMDDWLDESLSFAGTAPA
ncbi:MAG: prepilin peptidase [Verrucomicrobiales bacterium]|nr:prepilin peptidase [Verrucomicrobiales bacterium]MCP5527050.1 prepilin peptidase [Verrucomicrobiales bacterium]